MTEKPKNLQQRILAVMGEVGYVQKDAVVSTGGGSYRGVTHDAVAAMLRGAMAKHGIAMHVTQSGSDTVEGQTRSGGAKIRYAGWYDVTLINADNPDDRQTARIEAHAEDGGDKAPGKALSYAVKMLLLKWFMLETGESDESRYQPDEPILITDEQAREIAELIEETGVNAGKFLHWCGVDSVANIAAKNYQRAVGALRERVQQQANAAHATDQQEAANAPAH